MRPRPPDASSSGGSIPTDLASRIRIVTAGEAYRPASRRPEHQIGPGHSIAMGSESTDLRQKIRVGPVLHQGDCGPCTGRIVAGEYAGGPGQIPGRGNQQRDRLRQPGAGPVGGERGGFGQRSNSEVSQPAVRLPVFERVIDSPWRIGLVQNQDLRWLAPFRSRPVLPISVAGVEFAVMCDQEAHFGAAHETASGVARSRCIRDLIPRLPRRAPPPWAM